jgi:hypothetical protein
MGRWDHLADQKPVAIRDKVLQLAGDELVAELRAWPPSSLEWLDPALQARFEPALAQPGRPELDTLRVACEVARLELLREVERIDHFWRSPQARELLPTPLEEERAQFLVRFLVEGALELQEALQHRFRRAELAAVVERIEEQLLRGFRLRL